MGTNHAHPPFMKRPISVRAWNRVPEVRGCISGLLSFVHSSQLDGNIIHCAFLSPSSVWLAIFKTPNYADISVSLPSDSHRAALVLVGTDSPRLGSTEALCFLGQISSCTPTQSSDVGHTRTPATLASGQTRHPQQSMGPALQARSNGSSAADTSQGPLPLVSYVSSVNGGWLCSVVGCFTDGVHPSATDGKAGALSGTQRCLCRGASGLGRSCMLPAGHHSAPSPEAHRADIRQQWLMTLRCGWTALDRDLFPLGKHEAAWYDGGWNCRHLEHRPTIQHATFRDSPDRDFNFKHETGVTIGGIHFRSAASRVSYSGF
ncbi:hypothetical protein B0H14DRAFT_2619554 [Mycena olivaceomarginata]|nr:hypothetical protein B0H14DRAFT_2619554 [Mycena olivaceomarginata]